MSSSHILAACVEHELWVVLIDGVVGEMHAHLIHIIRGWLLVLLRGEPCKSFMIEVDSQWISACQ